MRARPLALTLGVALCSTFACETEHTLYLLRDRARVEPAAGGEGGASIFDAGIGGENDAGSPGTLSPEPCQKLGAEVCNGGDDDCNGAIDEGCSYTVSWARAPNGAFIGHETGGVDFFEPCPDGAVLVGLRVGFGDWLNQVAAICRPIALHADATKTPTAFTMTLGSRFDTSLAPANSTDPKNKSQDLLCADDAVLDGVDGTTSTDPARYIYGLRIHCAPPIVNAGLALEADVTQEQTVGPIVCASCSDTQSYNESLMIETGHIATSLFGGDGLWDDRVGVGSSIGSVQAK